MVFFFFFFFFFLIMSLVKGLSPTNEKRITSSKPSKLGPLYPSMGSHHFNLESWNTIPKMHIHSKSNMPS